MADTAEESAAQRAARLRREKRNAKIQAEGGDRLAKITQLSGRPAPAPEDPSMKPSVTASPQPRASLQPSSTTAPQPVSIEDPEEVDISDHYWTPSRSGTPVDSQLAFLQQSQRPRPQQQQQPQTNEDPMMRMMQQMLSGGGDPSSMDISDSAMEDLPPLLKAMMQGQRATAQQAAHTAPPSNYSYLWRVVHALFAMALGAYITATSSFNGTQVSRVEATHDDFGPRLFYIFATAEVVLQSTRYFVEKGRLQGTGWLATIANSGLVPEPWAGYVRVLGRYAVIWQTVVGDAMVVVFVLGALAWWRGGVSI